MDEIIITIAVSALTSVVTAVITMQVLWHIKLQKAVKTKCDKYSSAEPVLKSNTQTRIQPVTKRVLMSETNVHKDSNESRNGLNKQQTEECKEQHQRERRSTPEEDKGQKTKNSQTQHIAKVSQPIENASFTYYTVSDAKLVAVSPGQAYYYRAWSQDGKQYYQFYCESGRISKAINNHSSVLDPFCTKTDDSAEYDFASEVITDECGQLDVDGKISKKTIIKFR